MRLVCAGRKGNPVQFGAGPVQSSRATLGRSFKFQRVPHVLVLSTKNTARRRVSWNFGENVNKVSWFLCTELFWLNVQQKLVNEIFERGGLLKIQ